MKLGYMDRTEGCTIMIMPKHRKENLFDRSETTTEYATRFFKEIAGLGNILVVKLQGNHYRTVGVKYL